MNVALIHYRLVNLGGLETRLQNYLAYFHQQGHAVTVIYAKKAAGFPLPPDIREIKVRLGLVPRGVRKVYFAWKVGRLMQQEFWDFSLALGRTWGQTAILAPGTHRGYLQAMGKRYRGIDDRIQIRLEKAAFESAQKILACSEMIRQELIEHYAIAPENIQVLYPPLDEKRYYATDQDDREQLKRKYGMDPEKISLLFVSTSHKRKGVPLLWQVMEGLPKDQYELCIVGRPYAGTNEKIKYLGRFQDLREIYVAADLTVHPALYEPFGQVISESVRCQTPVFISSRVGAKEILPTGAGRVLPTQEVEAWREALLAFPEQTFEITGDSLSGKGIFLAEHMEQMAMAVSPQENQPEG